MKELQWDYFGLPGKWCHDLKQYRRRRRRRDKRAGFIVLIKQQISVLTHHKMPSDSRYLLTLFQKVPENQQLSVGLGLQLIDCRRFVFELKFPTSVTPSHAVLCSVLF